MKGVGPSLHGERPRSLRARLLLLVSLATLLIYVLAALLSYRQARHEVQELMDGQLVKSARLLLAQAAGEPAWLNRLADIVASQRGARVRRGELTLEFIVTRGDGTLVARSPQAPDLAVGKELGFANVESRGHPWRTLSLATADGSQRVLVAQSIERRNKEALEIATKTVLPLGVLLPLMIVLIYFSVRRGLKPLEELAAAVAARSPENLAPLVPNATLRETLPLVGALNRLFGRLAATLENERRFTADAAHELRTPLAALKIHAQVALASGEPQQSRAAVAKVIAGADRATRLVEQLLRLARLDPVIALPDPRPVDLVALATTLVEDFRLQGEGDGHPVHLSVEATPEVSGDRDLLAVALRNLLDNALRYGGGSAVTLRVGSEYGQPFLEVSDGGPGVAPADLPRLVERFYRGRDVTAEGSGLGLALVRRVAELHGARLEIENLPAGGFAARLRWCTLGISP